jgi:hypothetical protein
LPAVSTATQNDGDRHDTDVRLVVAIWIGVLHPPPAFVEISILPACPAATQNDTETHEMPPTAS